ncbi:MAG: plasmid encoded RepA protein, partial [Magnetococcales bacterium]|nr:plasmid encoded RepA protein [Magnetococcales bacterium]
MDRKPSTRQQAKILDTAVSLRMGQEITDAAFMARALVQATLPHSDPGDIPLWQRTNGRLTLSIKPDWERDPKTNKVRCVGVPYGTVPRLLLFWMTTEAIKTNSRRLELGNSLSSFMRELGMVPTGGRWGTIPRMKEQMKRLFRAKISFELTREERGANGFAWLDMQVAPKGVMWWDEKNPSQPVLFSSWIELSEEFFNAIKAAPVPVNTKALAALKNSSMALDLYALTTFVTFQATQTGQARFISWEHLQQQLGTGYDRIDNLRMAVKENLRKIQAV